MKASRAYIAGLGTSGILIASFLLLLMVGSAIVAFRGAPGQASNDGLDRLDMSQDTPASKATRAERPDGGLRRSHGAERGRRDSARGAGDSRRENLGGRSAGGAGGVDADRAAGGLTGGLAGGGEPGGSAAAAGGGSDTGDGEPRQPAEQPEPGTSPTLGDVTDGLAGAVEQTTGGLGETVGRVAPPLEPPVVGTGEALGGVVEQTGPVLDDTVNGVTGTVGGVTDTTGGLTGGLVGGAP